MSPHTKNYPGGRSSLGVQKPWGFFLKGHPPTSKNCLFCGIWYGCWKIILIHLWKDIKTKRFRSCWSRRIDDIWIWSDGPSSFVGEIWKILRLTTYLVSIYTAVINVDNVADDQMTVKVNTIYCQKRKRWEEENKRWKISRMIMVMMMMMMVITAEGHQNLGRNLFEP